MSHVLAVVRTSAEVHTLCLIFSIGDQDPRDRPEVE